MLRIIHVLLLLIHAAHFSTSPDLILPPPWRSPIISVCKYKQYTALIGKKLLLSDCFAPLFFLIYTNGSPITRGGSVRRGACRTRLVSPDTRPWRMTRGLALLPSSSFSPGNRDE